LTCAREVFEVAENAASPGAATSSKALVQRRAAELEKGGEISASGACFEFGGRINDEIEALHLRIFSLYPFRNMASQPELKYQELLLQFDDCPPQDYQAMNCLGYRFVFESDAQTNFLPVLVKSPTRFQSDGDAIKCVGYGLSFFVTSESAERKFVKLKKAFPMIHKKIGGLLAKVHITPSHGIVSTLSKEKHFTLHEFKNAQWKCQIIKSLI